MRPALRIGPRTSSARTSNEVFAIVSYPDARVTSRFGYVPPQLPAPTGGALAGWIAELASVPSGLALAYLPGSGGVNARTREQLILAVNDVDRCRYSAWVHGAWLDFLGRRDPDEAMLPLFDYARSSAEAGHPLDTTVLEAVYPRAVVRSVRATVARAEIANIVDASAEDLVETARGRRTASLRRLAREAAIVTASLPLTVPAVATATLMKALDAVAPKLPEVITPPDSEGDLVVDLAAEAVPTYLGNTILRTGLVWAPMNISIAFRMEGKAFTLTVGRGAVCVSRGVSRRALIVVDGGLDSMLKVVASRVAGELTNPRPLRSR